MTQLISLELKYSLLKKENFSQSSELQQKINVGTLNTIPLLTFFKV